MYQIYKSKIHLPYTSQPKFKVPFFIIQFFKSKAEFSKNIYSIDIFCILKYKWKGLKIKNFLKKKKKFKKEFL
jgi:hypothetical protein